MYKPLSAWASRARLSIIASVLSVLIVLAAIPSAALAATGDCEAWDGGTYHGVLSSDVIQTATGTYTTGNAAVLYGIRFKALGTAPVFAGWNLGQPGTQGGQYSFYLFDWSNNTLMSGYVEGITLGSGPRYVDPGPANYQSLTSGHEYIAMVDVYHSYYTINVNVPILNPNTLNNLSATSGSVYYSAPASGWPHPTWTNANPSAGDNWTISPMVCQTT